MARTSRAAACLIAIAISTLTSPAAFAFIPSKKSCITVQQKIDKIDSKLRAGVSASQGEKLKDKLRDYKERRYQCQKKRYKTER